MVRGHVEERATRREHALDRHRPSVTGLGGRDEMTAVVRPTAPAGVGVGDGDGEGWVTPVMSARSRTHSAIAVEEALAGRPLADDPGERPGGALAQDRDVELGAGVGQEAKRVAPSVPAIVNAMSPLVALVGAAVIVPRTVASRPSVASPPCPAPDRGRGQRRGPTIVIPAAVGRSSVWPYGSAIVPRTSTSVPRAGSDAVRQLHGDPAGGVGDRERGRPGARPRR